MADTLNHMIEDDLRQSILDSAHPDDIARLTRVARQAGESPSEVDGRVDQYEKSLQAQHALYLTRDNPALARWAASNPDGMAMAADDYSNLRARSKSC